MHGCTRDQNSTNTGAMKMIEALMYFGGGVAIGLVARMIYEEYAR